MVTIEQLCKLIRGQARSADLWIAEYERHKDVSGVRNAAMAIGKISGMYNVLVSMGIEIPDDIQALSIKYNNIWANLEVA